jgi:hypothetical protein
MASVHGQDSELGVQIDYDVVHLRTSLVQLFVLLQLNFEEIVQIIELRRFGGAPNGYPFAPLLGVLGICDACMFLCVVLTLLPSSATSSLYFFLIVDERLFGSYYQFNCSSRWICRQIRESYVLVFAKMFCPFRTP